MGAATKSLSFETIRVSRHPELLIAGGQSMDSLALELGIPLKALESRMSSSPCVSTLSSTCSPFGYEVMLVPAGARIEGCYRITE